MNPTLTLAARTIERQLSIAGYGMMFAASDTSVENEKRALGLFQSYQVDGILIYPANHKNLSHIKAVEEAGYPVLVLADLSLTGIDVVAIDDREGAYKAISHVLSKGHRQIAMLDGGRPLENTEKLEGALRALADRGLATNCLQVLDPRGHSAEQGYLAMGEAIGLNPRPTALFASTDSLAIGAVRWCRDKGLAVPRDMAIVGYDNTEASEFCSVPLTTVNYAADEVSRLAVDRIISKITTRPEPETPAVRLIEPELIVREST